MTVDHDAQPTQPPNSHCPAVADASAHRRLIELALRVDDVRLLRDAGKSPLARRWSQWQLRRAIRRAVEDGGLVPLDGRDRNEVLVDLIAALRGITALTEPDATAPPTVTRLAQHSQKGR